MNKLVLAALAALSLGLAACVSPGTADPPLAGTSVDEQAITLAFETADAVRVMVGELREARHPCCVPGTAAAQTMASRLDTLARALQAASAAQRAGNSREALTALSQAQALVKGIRAAISRESS